MPRVLAIADEVDPYLYSAQLAELRPDVVVACGDLPFDYLEYVVTIANVPLLYVPGNHDPDLSRRAQRIEAEDFVRPLSVKPWDYEPPGPKGCTSIDGRITDAAGLRIAGLGGSMRYGVGPNQYTESQMRRRALALELRYKKKRMLDRRAVDVVVTHAPPLGVGDQEDPCHRGFDAFRRLVAAMSPRYLIHGHVHPYGQAHHDRRIGSTTVVNAVRHRVIEVS